MAATANPDYDPGFVNAPGKGQSPANPLGSVFIQSLAVVSDLSVYQNIFVGSTINAVAGYTLGVNNFLSPEGFQINPPGNFKSDINIDKNVTVGGVIIMEGQSFKPTVIETISGSHLVLAAS